MDYFKQRRAYRDFKLYEENVSMGQNNLYRELLDYANDKGLLDDRFKLKNPAIASLTGLSESGVKSARNTLVQMGLIEYTKGKKKETIPEYKIVCLYKKASGSNSVPKKDPDSNSKPTKCPKQSGSSVPDRVASVSQTVSQSESQTVSPVITTTDYNLTTTQQDVDNSAVAFWSNQINAGEKPIVLEQIQSYVSDFKDDQVVILAMKMTVDNGASSFNYTKAILNSWINHTPPLTTIEQIKAFEKQRREKRNASKNNGYNRKPARTEVVPERFKGQLNQEVSPQVDDDYVDPF